jgi:hypothetical protein
LTRPNFDQFLETVSAANPNAFNFIMLDLQGKFHCIEEYNGFDKQAFEDTIKYVAVSFSFQSHSGYLGVALSTPGLIEDLSRTYAAFLEKWIVFVQIGVTQQFFLVNSDQPVHALEEIIGRLD